MPTAIITVGLPKSGKTSVALDLLRSTVKNGLSEYVVIDRGMLRKEIAPRHKWMSTDNQVEEATRKLFAERMAEGIRDGKNLLVGGTNIATSYRVGLINKLKRDGYDISVWLFDRKMNEILQSFQGLGEVERELRRIIGRFNPEFLELVDDRLLEQEAEKMEYELVTIHQKVVYETEISHYVK